MPLGGIDDIGLNLQIVAQELCRLAAIGFDSADLGRRQVHLPRPVLREKLLHRGRRPQVEFGAITKQQTLRAVRTQTANDGGTHQAPMAGHKDARIVRTGHSRA